MNDDREDGDSTTVVVQFRVTGFGTDEEFQRRCRMEELLEAALEAADNGSCGGADMGSGTANIFLDVKDAGRAVTTAVEVLRGAGLLDGVVIAADDGDGFVDRWPEGHAGGFSLL